MVFPEFANTTSDRSWNNPLNPASLTANLGLATNPSQSQVNSSSGSGAMASEPVSLVFIDQQVSHSDRLAQTFADQLKNEMIFVLDGAQDGITQISQILDQFSTVDNIYILSHGSPGHLTLGSSQINASTLTSYGDQLQGWQRHLSEDADILFYGCNLAAGEDGAHWLDQMALFTGADVAASNDPTGSATLGGDWNLEVQRGAIAAPTPDPLSLASYDGLLEQNGLRAEYFNNIDFTDLAFVRNDATVDFDWGTGSPDARIGADTFSVRWSGQIVPRFSEVYTFYTTSDDGIRLTVNGQVLIDKLVDQSVTPWSGSITLQAGQRYDITLEYYERSTFAVAKLEWSSASQAREIVPASQLLNPTVPTGAGDGLRAEYFNNENFTDPVLVRTDATINFDWGLGSPDPRIGADTFSARWTGQILPRHSEIYTFYATADDGVRLTINGQVLIDKLVDQTRTEWPGAIALQAGQKYDIQLDYYEQRTFAGVKLEWVSPSQTREVVPQSQLFSTPQAADTSAPTADLLPNSVTKIGTNLYEFKVVYGDNTAINASTIDNTDVRLLGSNGYSRTATLIGLDSPSNGTPRTATYQVAVPNPVGTINYTLSLQANEIRDTAGNGAIAKLLGSFQDRVTPPPSGNGDGLRGEYYDNSNFTDLKLTRIDPTLNFDWGLGSPTPSLGADTFAVRWSGQILPRYSETYTFYATADDGIRVKVNGQPIIDQLVDRSITESRGTITLQAGQKYDIEVSYYDNQVFAVAKLEWSSASQAREIIPQSQLFSPTQPNVDTNPPTATLNAPTLDLAGANPYRFDLTFTDATAVDISSLDNSDVRVTGPNGFNQLATLVQVNTPSNGSPRIATYQITPPGGSWDVTDNGLYAIALQTNQVRDTLGNLMPALNLGNLTVAIATTPAPTPWRVTQPGYVVERVATGFQLPVNMTFVPNPGSNPTDPLYYVTELYGNIKVVSRDGRISNYATNLLNFNPTGELPGSGELGVTGIAIDPLTGDVYASMLYDRLDTPDPFTYPKVVKFTSTDGGKTAATAVDIIQMPNDIQGQAHQISNLSFGPDGKLYVNMGDGFDVPTALNLESFRGKILRMNKDGSAPTDNPFYNAADGITAKDYVYAYGFRNPFGGDWRATDGKYYQVENGPESNDRLSTVIPGGNYGWDGTAASMTTNALYLWPFPVAPLDIDFIEPQTFNGSGFPTAKYGNAYVSAVGFTYATGTVPFGKEIFEFSFNSDGTLAGQPTSFLEYDGTGQATVSAIAAGPDGLYFADLYQDLNAPSPIAPGANVWRIRYVG